MAISEIVKQALLDAGVLDQHEPGQLASCVRKLSMIVKQWQVA